MKRLLSLFIACPGDRRRGGRLGTRDGDRIRRQSVADRGRLQSPRVDGPGVLPAFVILVRDGRLNGGVQTFSSGRRADADAMDLRQCRRNRAAGHLA
jgi:hypothetical protein